MSPQDLDQIRALVDEGLRTVDNFNKLYIGIGTLVGVLLGIVVQFLSGVSQRNSQEGIARKQDELQRALLKDQLALQEAVAKRIAIDNVSAKRQIWIDELRKDMAAYLTLQQEIAYLWHAAVLKAQAGELPKNGPENLSKAIVPLHKEAMEIKIRIALRLNPDEKPHTELLSLMNDIESNSEKFLRDRSDVDINVLLSSIKSMIPVCVEKLQRILKTEWRRIKSGQM